MFMSNASDTIDIQTSAVLSGVCSECEEEFPTIDDYRKHICGLDGPTLAEFDTPVLEDFGVNGVGEENDEA